ncbi:MAG: tyrosine-type recombinase/integrase, partial [Thermomicrobiales bacterium]
RDFQALRERAGLPPMRFHDLRHSCISFLAAQGVPARTAMEIAGHSQITLTMNVYAHIGDEAKRAALGGLGRLLAAGG